LRPYFQHLAQFCYWSCEFPAGCFQQCTARTSNLWENVDQNQMQPATSILNLIITSSTVANNFSRLDNSHSIIHPCNLDLIIAFYRNYLLSTIFEILPRIKTISPAHCVKQLLIIHCIGLVFYGQC